MSGETAQMLEDAIVNALEAIDAHNLGTKERSEAVSEVCKLSETLIAIEHDADEYEDKVERRKIERDKNDSAVQLEAERQKITWQKVALEFGKILIPSVLSIAAYDMFQRRVLNFEENGKITSTAGRDLHLPNLPINMGSNFFA
jgi:hypothetical protein